MGQAKGKAWVRLGDHERWQQADVLEKARRARQGWGERGRVAEATAAW
jgi:hypothetical protein